MPSLEIVYIYTSLGAILGLGHLMATRDLLASVEFGMTSIGALCVLTSLLGVMIAGDRN